MDVPTLKTSLFASGFHEALDPRSAPLVESLLAEVLSSRAKIDTLKQTANSLTRELAVAEQLSPPLRKEHGRLVRENGALRAELMQRLELEAEAKAEAEAEQLTLLNQLSDISFISASLHEANERLEKENAGLREMAARGLASQGMILTEQHEVRWHGQGECQIAHSPLPKPKKAATATAPAGSDAAATSLSAAGSAPPADAPTRLVAAAEAQLSLLIERVGKSEARSKALEEMLHEARGMVGAREAEVARLNEELASSREEVSSATASPPEASAAAIGQMNHQVNFLNAQVNELEAALAAERAESRGVRMDDEERTKLVGQADRHAKLVAEVASALRPQPAGRANELRELTAREPRPLFRGGVPMC